jgi:hypothetical protein
MLVKVDIGELPMVLNGCCVIDPSSFYFIAKAPEISVFSVNIYLHNPHSILLVLGYPFISRCIIYALSTVIAVLSLCSYSEILRSVIKSIVIDMVCFEFASLWHSGDERVHGDVYPAWLRVVDGTETFAIAIALRDPREIYLDKASVPADVNDCFFTSREGEIATGLSLNVERFGDHFCAARLHPTFAAEFVSSVVAFSFTTFCATCFRIVARLVNLLIQGHIPTFNGGVRTGRTVNYSNTIETGLEGFGCASC